MSRRRPEAEAEDIGAEPAEDTEAQARADAEAQMAMVLRVQALALLLPVLADHALRGEQLPDDVASAASAALWAVARALPDPPE